MAAKAPVRGDVLIPNGWIVDRVSAEGIVFFQGRHEFILAIDLEYVSANTWRLRASVKATNL